MTKNTSYDLCISANPAVPDRAAAFDGLHVNALECSGLNLHSPLNANVEQTLPYNNQRSIAVLNILMVLILNDIPEHLH